MRPLKCMTALMKSPTLYFPRTHSHPHSPISASGVGMSSAAAAPSQIIEHVVLFKVKDGAGPAEVAAWMSGLNSLTCINQVLYLSAGPIHRNRSSAFEFTHMLHSRYRSKADLSAYSGHPSHLRVVKELGAPVCEDVTAVDWVADDFSGLVAPLPGSAARLTLMKLNEGLGDEEKAKVLGAVREIEVRLAVSGQMTYGENFSPARSKGFSVAAMAMFPGLKELEALDSNPEVSELGKDKVRELLEGVIVVDYVVTVPPPHSASL